MLRNGLFLPSIPICIILLATIGYAQKNPARTTVPQSEVAPLAPASKPEDGSWDEIDQRLIFLIVRLANLEASLDAVDAAIVKSSLKITGKKTEAKRAEGRNDQMDRNGGGPMKWSQFYGETADKFFFHPTGRNATYHTETILIQQSQGGGRNIGTVVSGVPVIQRPPQFDYIYRANENAKANAEKEADALKDKIDKLIERKHRLEVEQSGLWCEVAFRSVSHYDLHKKPLYRFEVVANETEPNAKRHLEVIKSAADFMRLSLSIIDAAQKDQTKTFKTIKTTVANAREKLDDTFLRQAVDTSDKKTTEGKFAALAKILEDVANNLSDSYVVSVEGEKENDQFRKDTFRGLLQQSLVTYAQLILALDEMAVVMRDDYKIKPDLEKPIAVLAVSTNLGVTQNSSQNGSEKEMDAAEISSPLSEPINNDSDIDQKGMSLDLIRLVRKPQEHTVKGAWLVSNDVLSSAKGRSVLGFPVEVFGNYELSFDLKRTQGNDVIFVTLPVAKRNVYLELSANHGEYHGLSFVDGVHSTSNGTASRPGNIQNGVWQNVRINVGQQDSKSAINLWINGKKSVTWTGDAADLGADKNWSPPRKSQIGIAAADSQIELRKMKVKGSVRADK